MSAHGGLPEDSEIFRELERREPLFHRPELGFTRAHFEAMTEPEFWEVGASGRIYARDEVLRTLDDRYASGPYPDAWEKRDFACRAVARDLYLVTYTLLQGARVTRRASLWRRREGAWRIVYHQGTIVEGAPQ